MGNHVLGKDKKGGLAACLFTSMWQTEPRGAQGWRRQRPALALLAKGSLLAHLTPSHSGWFVDKGDYGCFYSNIFIYVNL